MVIITNMGYLVIADELDKDGDIHIIADGYYNIYLNWKQARDLIIQIETVFANSGKALFDASAKLAQVTAERDALKARLDGGIRVNYYKNYITTWISKDRPDNATVVLDKGKE